MKLHELLNERIYSQGSDLVITIQTSKDASTKEEISTFIRRQPLETNLKGSNGSVIYSILNYISSPETTKLLSSIKGKGPYKINHTQLDGFMKQVANAAAQAADKVKPDVIIFPKSSSPLVSEFVHRLSQQYPSAKVVSDAFIKRALRAEDVEPLINTGHPDWERFSKENPADVKKMKQSLSKMIKDSGGLELKKLYKPYMKFVKNFIEMRDAYEVLDSVLEKNVLVIDDVLSSGSTMLEMIRQIVEMEPKMVAGLTIFKHTTQKTL